MSVYDPTLLNVFFHVSVAFLIPIIFIWLYNTVQNGRRNLAIHMYRGAAHDDVIKWKHFPRYWPFVRGIHRSTVNSLTQSFDVSLICAWTNSWANNTDAGDLRRYCAQYDVIVILNSSYNLEAANNFPLLPFPIWTYRRPVYCLPSISFVSWYHDMQTLSLLALNTLRPRQMAAISQTTLSNPFSWMKVFEFRLKFHWSLFLRFQLTIFQHWFR